MGIPKVALARQYAISRENVYNYLRTEAPADH